MIDELMYLFSYENLLSTAELTTDGLLADCPLPRRLISHQQTVCPGQERSGSKRTHATRSGTDNLSFPLGDAPKKFIHYNLQHQAFLPYPPPLHSIHPASRLPPLLSFIQQKGR